MGAVVVGLDMGSVSTKAAVLQDSRMVGYAILPTGFNPQDSGRRAINEACEKAGINPKDVVYIVATGYGRINAPFANSRVTEITCHGKGAFFANNCARTVIDVGGQDSKVISINEQGRVVDFQMNDRCAAGTGRFLEVMMKTLDMNYEEMSQAAINSENPSKISNMCTVFAESEVITLLAKGERRENIAAGLCQSIAERIATMVKRIGLREEVVMTGGVAKNRGVVKLLENKLNTKISVPEEPQIIGALGAALEAREAILEIKQK
ncbi:MAG: 2-hydroxyglutaryl-CoA dehydratase [Candidatus Freyarchaeota archaeon]|nr:2-hydroxyglutaryl-CoA dehydratase [Candidatus Jordarchaeia archaeon]MBS7268273.1 2-hydroxyglutaryl-CoA dehydratase [Candidatus Jordarchaeia archaeon]MBS7279201.1 2-hydroxyglutaryl-CoA dehydratase [Candidatus Jordarchaeia archaeon]